MSISRRTASVILLLAVFFNCAPPALACGPESIEPIFVFKNSPDPPFDEFARGKIGVLLPTMGRKTLFIAYRYINGGSFTGEEQRALIDALKGKAPEDEGEDAIRAWIKVRKEAAVKGEQLPAIYTERQYTGYDFFPNCTRNAFETASETLRARITSHGAENIKVREWLSAQDLVFQNCAGGSTIPEELTADQPEWLRKDRDYQIGAAYFYSLNLEEARKRFEAIAVDNSSPWQQTADYLVARTLVRQASLANNDNAKREFYERAERHLQLLIGSGGRFLNASQKLIGLIDYRLRPQERVGELGRILAYRSGNENLRQDLIDYVWLLDKFEAQVVRDEEARKEALKKEKEGDKTSAGNIKGLAIDEMLNESENIEIAFYPKKADGLLDYENYYSLKIKHDATEAEILQRFAQHYGRNLTPDEVAQIQEIHKSALQYRKWSLAPNQKLDKVIRSEYEGDYYNTEDKPVLGLLPPFLRSDDLSDLILTFQNTDPSSYTHAVTKWSETGSTNWLLAALVKSDVTSSQVQRLITQAEKVSRDSAAFPTIAYHLIRLRIALGKRTEARQLLEDVLSSGSDLLPVSAQNRFLEIGMQLTTTLDEFLRFSQRKPAAFYRYGTYGKISDIVKAQKRFWNAEDFKQSKEVYDQEIDESYKKFLAMEDQFTFDEKAFELFNWHFPVADLAAVGHNPLVPDYLQQRILLVVWTRAVLLKNEKLALRVAGELIKLAPSLESVFQPYLDARTSIEREYASLLVLLRSPDLSPLVSNSVPSFMSSAESDYYFELSWWCTPSQTTYDENYNEVPLVVQKPRFLSNEQVEIARRERASLIEIGDAKSYLGKRAIAWAKKRPNDERVAEALFIAVKANQSYKYGCGGWEADAEVVKEAEKLLVSRYPNSIWAAKLKSLEK